MDIGLGIFDNDLYEDDLEILDILQFKIPRGRYRRSSYFTDLDDTQFFQRFRLRKPTVLNLLSEIEDQLEYPHDLNDSVSPINQVLTTLRYFATGGHISSVADYMSMHTSTASRIIAHVSEVIASLKASHITMPEEENEVLQIQHDFFNISSFPRVLGCIDGTHIKVQLPGGADAKLFKNKKSYCSINTQVLGDSKLRIRDIEARWPGSTADATILNHSSIQTRFEAGQFPNSVILGDGAYSLTSYLLTPLRNPVTRCENLYNQAHIKTINLMERLFGLWKRRFPVLAFGTRVKHNTALNIIVATAVLHNIAISMNEEEPPLPEEVNVERLNYLLELGDIPNILDSEAHNQEALNTRNLFIKNYFASN